MYMPEINVNPPNPFIGRKVVPEYVLVTRQRFRDMTDRNLCHYVWTIYFSASYNSKSLIDTIKECDTYWIIWQEHRRRLSPSYTNNRIYISEN